MATKCEDFKTSILRGLPSLVMASRLEKCQGRHFSTLYIKTCRMINKSLSECHIDRALSRPGGSFDPFRTGIRLILLLFFIFSQLTPSGPVHGSGEPGRQLAQQVLSILERYRQDPADWGILVRSLQDGTDLVSLNSRRRFIPASNLKLLVTAVALVGLGVDFRYRTSVMAVGEISPGDSVLDGDLVLRGSGDPTISDRFYQSAEWVWDELASQVHAAGIRRVTGSLVADNTLFSPPHRADGWSWEDLMWYYAAPVSAISYNDNCIDLEVLPGPEVGRRPQVRFRPDGVRLQLINRASTVASRIDDRLLITRDSPSGRLNLDGGIHYRSLGFVEHVSVESPAVFASEAFLDALARQGVRIDGPVRVLNSPADSASYLERSPLILAQHTSVPLSEIIRVINKRSHNFYAEQLLFTLGACLGEEGSFAGGLEVEKRFLSKLGLDTGTLRIEDGSGLSRLNLVTTEMFVRLLAYMDKHSLRQEYVSSLPVGGIDNGMRLMRRTTADGKVFAKTGYISSVMALSGYSSTADEEPVAFSIMGNNWLISRRAARRLIRDVCLAVTEFSRGLQAAAADTLSP